MEIMLSSHVIAKESFVMPPSSQAQSRTPIARPLYTQVRELMLERIERGDWRVGDMLPNEFLLSTEFGVSIGTIRRAVEGLEESGLVVRKQGRGTFVSGRLQAVDARQLQRLVGTDGRLLAATEHFERATPRAIFPAEALSLRCAPNSTVLQIDHFVRSDGRVVGRERTVVSVNDPGEFDECLAAGGHMYDALFRTGRTVFAFADTVAIERADTDLASALQLTAGAIVLSIRRVLMQAGDTPVALRRGWYRPDRVSYRAAFECHVPDLAA
jgi:GntR family transcriptional regulator